MYDDDVDYEGGDDNYGNDYEEENEEKDEYDDWDDEEDED